MKKFILYLTLILIATTAVYAAKYTVNSSGTVKNQGKVVAPINNPYSVYTPAQYINSKAAISKGTGIVDIVMDYSGSMANSINAAKKAMSTIVAQIPSNTNLGFRVFGHDGNGVNPVNTVANVKQIVKSANGKYKVQTENILGSSSSYCRTTKRVAPVAKANAQALLSGMNSVDLGGATPLVYGLSRAVEEDFQQFPASASKKIILITDGGENCGGDACAFAKKLVATHPEIHIDVVIIGGNMPNLNCLANTTGGRVYDIYNLHDFANILEEAITAQPDEVQQPNQGQQYEFYKD